jgi:hypothetical protein
MPIQGVVPEFVAIAPNKTDVNPVSYFVAKAAYVAGGIIFAFPAGLFAGTPGNGPWITVGVEQKNLLFLPTFAITHFIDEVDDDHVRIRVVKADLLAVVEVATDDVVVHIHVWGRPPV